LTEVAPQAGKPGRTFLDHLAFRQQRREPGHRASGRFSTPSAAHRTIESDFEAKVKAEFDAVVEGAADERAVGSQAVVGA
jgi:hypothetical protein